MYIPFGGSEFQIVNKTRTVRLTFKERHIFLHLVHYSSISATKDDMRDTRAKARSSVLDAGKLFE